MSCSVYLRKWSKYGGFVIIGLILLVKPLLSENAVCLSCDRVPYPRDCDRIVQCGDHESCYTEQMVSSRTGTVYYNSGCLSKQQCTHAKKRNVVSLARKTDDFKRNQPATSDFLTCIGCCNSSNYCNRNMCIPSSPALPNRTYCLNCPNVLQPKDCDFLVLCGPEEVCYTQLYNLHGENRYRMGCIHKSACSETPSPALVGKKRFIVDSTSLSTYCGKCCENDIGNCNRELCAKNGSLQPNTKVMELVNPPMQIGYCTDLYPQSCRILLIQNPNLCKETKFSHYACREYCGTCVNPGHHTLVPTTTGSTTTTTSSSSKYNTKDCYYNSRKYMGAQSITVSGKMCLNWVDINPNMQGLPDTSVDKARNECRDPKGYGRPWCFTSATTYDWEFCRIPVCQECFYQGNSWQYAGYVSVDKDNNTCLPWTNYTSQFGIHIDNFPDGSTINAQNFCRDPFHSGTPMCFSGSKLNPCNVPVCPHTCRDDPEINCALVKQYVCRYEYTSVTMCPRTCNSCKFGLLPPLPQVSSSVCVDNPNANCQTLQSIICADSDGAQKLCPKTCNKCYV